MTTQINQDNIQPSTLAELGSGPTVTNIQITNSSYVVLDDTAVSTSGGYIKITGTNFASGCEVIIGTTNATAVALVSSTVLNVQVPALSAGTYVVYVVNIDGSVAIRVNGLTFSGTPTWVTGSTLTSGAVNVAISIQLSATGDAPLTYSLASGSSLPSGLTLTSGGLLSGTITGITVETIYNFTIDAIDAQLQESPRSFSITISVSDQYFPYVSSLLSATALTLPFNNDASTNNFLVTVVGDTRPNNFGPYTPGYYSNFFDGTGDYLTVPNNINLTIGSGDFTIECWVYISGAQTTTFGYSVAGPSTNQGSSGWGIVVNRSTDNRGFGFVVQNAFVSNDSTFLPANQWQHLAVTRSGSGSNNLKLFKNGVISSQTTYTTTDTYVATPVFIGADGLGGQGFPGYISNFRFVSGTAVYTSAFTPPTQPLTAIANTSLLTCQSNRFIDNSTNTFTITRNGDTLVSGFDPFVPDTNYSTYGSTYFDGTGDYLSLASSSAFNFGAANFTVEAWYYFTALPGSGTNDTLYTFGSFNPYLYLWGDGTIVLRSAQSSGDIINVAHGFTVNQWYHIAVVKTGTSFVLYRNGSVLGSGTSSAIVSENKSLEIGGQSTFGFTGYMSDFRTVNGTAVYTSAFTPPTAPLTAVSGTSLLTLQTNQPNNNNMFLDSSTNNFLVTRNGNTTQGSFSPYGPLWSNFFDGNGDYLSLASSSAFNMGVSNFTVEAWYYFTELPGAGTNDNLYTFGSFNPYLYLWGDGTIVLRSAQSSGDIINVSHGFTVGQWYHLALVKTGTSFVLYRNGSVLGSGTSAAIVSQNKSLEIGGQSTFGFTGYMSNFRTVNGTAVYTSAFTPSTSPLTAIANTSLLTCTDNRLIDDSPNNFTITRNGDVSVQRFSPFSPQTVTTFYSANFTVKSQFLSIPATSSLITFASAFTFEAWIYPTDTSIIYWGLWDSRQAGASAQAMVFNIDPLASPVAGQGRMMYYNGSYHYGTSTVNYNTWTHVAWVRSGTTMTFYVNGVAGGTATVSGTQTGTATSNPVYIGSKDSGSASYGLVGYISNFRIVNGTAVYTSNFTPSTQPLTAIANTSLLTCQSATFIDNSTNNFTITAGGVVAPSTVSPFTPTATTGVAYSPSVYGGSMYFDGTGDWLVTTTSPATLSGSFTIEAWVYITSLAASRSLVCVGDDNTSTGALFFVNTSGRLAIFGNGGNILVGTSRTVAVNTWNHIAFVRSSGTITAYLNGVADSTTASNSTAFTGANRIGGELFAGNAGGTIMLGYISNYRLVNGTAVYTSNFAPPVSPLTAIQNNVLLLNGTSAGVYDMSMMNNYETVGNTSLVTNIEKYGNSSLYFDGSGDWINIILTTNNLFAFGSGNFTIEFWFYGISVAGGVLLDCRPLSTNGAYPAIYLSTGQLRYYVSSADRITGGSLSTSTWYHIAVSRSVTSTRMFLDGTQIGSTYTDSNTYLTANVPLIGASGFTRDGQGIINGYIDDFRVTKGVARYTATFTPPSSPFITS
jgi:hypothetical protein